MLEEFKKFALKGNVLDMAVGIVIGASFGKIVSSFVASVVMPPLGLLIGGVDFRNLKLILREARGDGTAVTLDYGVFLQSVFDFLIVAFALFMAIKAINVAQRKRAELPVEPAPPSEEVLLLREIAKSLKK